MVIVESMDLRVMKLIIGNQLVGDNYRLSNSNKGLNQSRDQKLRVSCRIQKFKKRLGEKNWQSLVINQIQERKRRTLGFGNGEGGW